MEMTVMRLLAAAEEEKTDIETAGFFKDYMWIVGIVLIVVGLLLLYFGIKVGKGYRFMPEENQTQIVEDELPSLNADVVERRSTEIPDYSDKGEGKIVFREMLIRFSVEGQSFEEWINDSGEFGDTVPIKYNPNNPQEFHVYEGDEDFQGIPDENGDLAGNEEPEADTEGGNNAVKLTLMGIGLIILGIGIFVLIEGLTK